VETSDRVQTEVAAELEIMPTMLRRWQRKLQDSNDMPVSKLVCLPRPSNPSARGAQPARITCNRREDRLASRLFRLSVPRPS